MGPLFQPFAVGLVVLVFAVSLGSELTPVSRIVKSQPVESPPQHQDSSPAPSPSDTAGSRLQPQSVKRVALTDHYLTNHHLTAAHFYSHRSLGALSAETVETSKQG